MFFSILSLLVYNLSLTKMGLHALGIIKELIHFMFHYIWDPSLSSEDPKHVSLFIAYYLHLGPAIGTIKYHLLLIVVEKMLDFLTFHHLSS